MKSSDLKGLQNIHPKYETIHTRIRGRVYAVGYAEDAYVGYMTEIEEQIQIVRKETPEERKKRIRKDRYFTDWFAYDEHDRKVKTSKYFCAEKRSQS